MLGTLTKEDAGFKQELLNILNEESKEDIKKKEPQSKFPNLKKEAVFQVVLTGILTVLFILFVYLTFTQLTTRPEEIPMSGGHMEMYDPFTRAKDILTLILPLFTTVLSFWLGFHIQEKKVDQAESTANNQREMREKADTMMAKIEGRMMTMPENDDIKNLSNDIHKIMES